MENKIDFVIITVDGNDPKWRKKKNECLGLPEGDDRELRYRSWDNLQYWFRGVEKFAPWVNKVFFVTDDQAPDWINKDCEKLVLVNHEDFIPKEYLPTFSSHPIEHNLFRIEGLSEQFVYFNDDMFLLSPVKSTQYFMNGLPCDYAIESPISVYDRFFAHILSNNVLLINENYSRKKVLKEQRKKFYSLHYKKGFFQNLLSVPLKRDRFFGFVNPHSSNPMLKSTQEAVWKQSYHWLDETCRCKVRSDNDVNQYIYSYYQYVNGLFYPQSWGETRHMFRCSNDNLEEVARDIRSQRYYEVCVNDLEDLDFERAKEVINAAWNDILPEKSMFEK